MADGNSWSLEFDGEGVAWLTCDMPGASANVLSAVVIGELAGRLAEIRSRAPTGVVVRSAKASGFIAGADIHEFQKIKTPAEGYTLVRQGQAVIQQLEDLPCPSVALVHGFVLGGGLELALACTYRIGADEPSLSLGLPEVLLGIHPGFGGTVRAVRTIGARNALELMLKGRPFRGPKALATGLLDELAPQADIENRARALLKRRPFCRPTAEPGGPAARHRATYRGNPEGHRQPRALSGTLRHCRSVAKVRGPGCGRLRCGGAFHQ